MAETSQWDSEPGLAARLAPAKNRNVDCDSGLTVKEAWTKATSQMAE